MKTTHRDAVAAVDDDDSYSAIDDAIRKLRKYIPVILFSLLAVTGLYVIGALAYYFMNPSTQTTTLPFRLNFQGAETGHYPNGLSFNAAEIVSKPVLLTVHEKNDLGKVISFDDFAQSVFVLESNPATERLAIEYATKLSDTKLTPIERDRIEDEYKAKRASLSKNEYGLHFVTTDELRSVPPTQVKKALNDILSTWARYAAVNQRVMQHRVSVISPREIDSDAGITDPFIALHLLRAKILRANGNIGTLGMLPAAEIVQTKDKRSLDEVRNALGDILRYRIEPMILTTRPADPVAAVRFADAQLSFEERELRARQEEAAAAQNALSTYVNQTNTLGPRTADSAEQEREGERVTPQLSDTFLDRLVALTRNPSDVEYRQKLVDEMHRATMRIIPAQQAVDYNRSIVERLRTQGGSAADPAAVTAQVTALRSEVRKLVVDVNELYTALSKNLQPATELYTITAPTVRYTEHAVSAKRLVLIGVLLLLVAFPVIVIVTLVYDRVRRDLSNDVVEHEAAA